MELPVAGVYRRLFLTGRGAEHDAIPGVEVKAAFAPGDAASVRGLVAPVVDEGALKRTVHFPPGHWVALDGTAKHDGPSDTSVNERPPAGGFHARPAGFFN